MVDVGSGFAGHLAGVALSLILVVTGGLVAVTSLYLVLLAVAAFFHHRSPRSVRRPVSRLIVLVPAHNEADLITRCLESLGQQDYPRQLYDILVIADNCTDSTAAIALSLGAQVLVRDQPDSRGKGQALRWAMDTLLVGQHPPDAVVVVDADSVASPSLLTGLEARLQGGAEAVQGEYLALDENLSAKAQLRSAAFVLFHRVRFAGRAALGLPCHLVGNGMLFSLGLLKQHQWNAFTSAEDLEYSVDLRLAGIRPAFAADAGLRAPVPAGGRAARTQRLRWEGGRFHVVRSRLPKLVNAILHGRWSLIDAAIDLAVPPLGLLAAAASGGAGVAVSLAAGGLVPWWAAAPWLTAAVAVLSFVLLGLWAGRAPASTFAALALAPALVCSEFLTRLRLVGGLRATTWQRTERPSERGLDSADHGRTTPPRPSSGSGIIGPDSTARLEIGGVPIDPADADLALHRTMQAVKSGSFMQVCTVNLDFLVNARRDHAVRSVLRESQLNLADGAPVVWLSRLLGDRVAGRVAGSDFVPTLMARAEQDGARVFFLGGENGAAQLAVDRLREHHPSLLVAGVYEPPRASLDQMDNDEILRRLTEARADILLVALGHPKQDRWIHAQRDRLPVSVAMGVGCTFDLIAGQRHRAPSWMQMHGLEWLYRLVHEPRRLFVRYTLDAWWLVTVLIPLTLRYRLQNKGLGSGLAP